MPEPGTGLLVGTGLAVLGWRRRNNCGARARCAR
ncbi:MAG: PEP-CTERM sorting domain-containing protein [Planctomycetes bacterium]|nr:PEP-CTERM sorting domain-containing protein [Planctomycetota bacterium]